MVVVITDIALAAGLSPQECISKPDTGIAGTSEGNGVALQRPLGSFLTAH